MPVTYERELGVAVAAVREATALCRAVQGGIAPEGLEKKDRSPVTIADFGSQALVCRAIRAAFPADPIVAEEDGDELRRQENAGLAEQVAEHVRRGRAAADLSAILDWIDFGAATSYADRFWTLDPIDGTKGFLRGEQYAVALALVVAGQVQVAALACPNLPTAAGQPPGLIATAVRGQGASQTPLAGGDASPIRVSGTRHPAAARLCESVESAHSKHSVAADAAARLGIAAPPERLDSQAKYAVVARGSADIYLRLPTGADYREKIWDHAAGALVVAEAGGRVSDVAGRPLEFTHGSELAANRGIVVTNGLLHAAVLETLAALGVS